MGEYIPASIKFGGKLKREHVDELIERCMAFSLNDRWDDGTQQLTVVDLGSNLSNTSINYGNLDDIIDFCAGIGLDYEQWFDSGPDWSAGMKRGVGGVHKECTTDSDGNPTLSMKELRKVDNLAMALGPLLDLAKWWCTPLPPLEIIEGDEP